MATEAPTEAPPRLGSDCPNCGARVDPGQLVCLECGGRLALDYRRPGGWRLPAAVVGVVLLVAGAAFVVTLIAVDDDSKDEVAATKPEKATARQRTTPSRSRAESKPRRRAAIASWPRGRNGFTVVLLSAGDPASARTFAQNARRGGVRVGILRSDDYPNLGSNLWMVFSGVYATQAEAARVATGLRGRFAGAYPQLVQGARAGP